MTSTNCSTSCFHSGLQKMKINKNSNRVVNILLQGALDPWAKQRDGTINIFLQTEEDLLSSKHRSATRHQPKIKIKIKNKKPSSLPGLARPQCRFQSPFLHKSCPHKISQKGESGGEPGCCNSSSTRLKRTCDSPASWWFERLFWKSQWSQGRLFQSQWPIWSWPSVWRSAITWCSTQREPQRMSLRCVGNGHESPAPPRIWDWGKGDINIIEMLSHVKMKIYRQSACISMHE